MKIKLIENDAELDEALAYLDKLMESNVKARSVAVSDEIRLRAKLISDYERVRFPLLSPKPVMVKVSTVGRRKMVHIPAKCRLKSERVTIIKQNEGLLLLPV